LASLKYSLSFSGGSGGGKELPSFTFKNAKNTLKIIARIDVNILSPISRLSYAQEKMSYSEKKKSLPTSGQTALIVL
jgi:hypothetical protein